MTERKNETVEITASLGDRHVRVVILWKDLIPGADPNNLQSAVHAMIGKLFQEFIGPRTAAEAEERKRLYHLTAFIRTRPDVMRDFEVFKSA